MKHWVYFLLKGKRLVYVGCTMNYNRRVNEHRLNGLKFDSFRIIECADYDTASSYEKRWIKRFKPKYNRCGNPTFNVKDAVLRERAKEPINLNIHKERAQRLREFAIKEQKTISIVVENALEGQYGI